MNDKQFELLKRLNKMNGQAKDVAEQCALVNSSGLSMTDEEFMDWLTLFKDAGLIYFNQSKDYDDDGHFYGFENLTVLLKGQARLAMV